MFYRCPECNLEFHRDKAMFECVGCGSVDIVCIDDEEWDEDDEDE